MESTFTEDPKIQEMAEAYALDAVDFARQNFRLTLDWTDVSVAKIESMMDDFDTARGKSKPNDEAVWSFAKMFGSYIGEVYCKNHGGSWGMITLAGQSFPGIRAPHGNLFWPWGRVQNRMNNGREDNLLHYYRALLDRTPS